jgi:hypothetical protein
MSFAKWPVIRSFAANSGLVIEDKWCDWRDLRNIGEIRDKITEKVAKVNYVPQ